MYCKLILSLVNVRLLTMKNEREKKTHNKHEFCFIWLKRKLSYIINIPNPNSFVCWGCSNTKHAWAKSNISYPFTVLFKSRFLVKQFGAPQRNLNQTKQKNDFINVITWLVQIKTKASPYNHQMQQFYWNGDHFIVKSDQSSTYLVIMATSSKKFSIWGEVTTLNFMWTCHYMLDLLEN